jgi:hypothetical protein
MYCEMTFNQARLEGQTPNTGLAKVAVLCSADTFVVNQSLVLRINICGENRHLRQARNRQAVKKPRFSVKTFKFYPARIQIKPYTEPLFLGC